MDKSNATVHGPGLMGGLTGLAKNVFGLLASRAELAAIELSEVRKHVISLVAIAALAVFCSWFAIAYGTATIVALAWDAMGWKILLIMFLVFAAITAFLGFKAKSILQQGIFSLPETMKELKNDRDMLL